VTAARSQMLRQTIQLRAGLGTATALPIEWKIEERYRRQGQEQGTRCRSTEFPRRSAAPFRGEMARHPARRTSSSGSGVVRRTGGHIPYTTMSVRTSADRTRADAGSPQRHALPRLQALMLERWWRRTAWPKPRWSTRIRQRYGVGVEFLVKGKNDAIGRFSGSANFFPQGMALLNASIRDFGRRRRGRYKANPEQSAF